MKLSKIKNSDQIWKQTIYQVCTPIYLVVYKGTTIRVNILENIVLRQIGTVIPIQYVSSRII